MSEAVEFCDECSNGLKGCDVETCPESKKGPAYKFHLHACNCRHEGRSRVRPSAEVARLRAALVAISGLRCERHVRDRALDERDAVIAWLRGPASDREPDHGPLLRAVALNLEDGSHIPPAVAQARAADEAKSARERLLFCHQAGIPRTVWCPSCRAHDALGVDPETGEAIK